MTCREIAVVIRRQCCDLGGLPLPDGERVGVRGFELIESP
jgi:hypothetical protein